ncbi:hypothetical protein MTTB_p240 (plasmid) [Methanothermobacter tenebrarum]|uniref:Uncharacterized protein n=1 Tax=Methanothermobacter tenebrarum TaxID=680118 RepID=A0ABN6PH39_9EURY|nr:hypothetical protein MTTB_p240 [Methanothermobacter tenebrarum]
MVYHPLDGLCMLNGPYVNGLKSHHQWLAYLHMVVHNASNNLHGKYLLSRVVGLIRQSPGSRYICVVVGMLKGTCWLVKSSSQNLGIYCFCL